MSNARGQGTPRAGSAAPRARRAAAVPLVEAVREYLDTSGLGQRLGHFQIYRAWSLACGLNLAKRARAVKFARNELVVEVDSASHLAELAGFTGEARRKRANEILGSDVILKVRFQLKR